MVQGRDTVAALPARSHRKRGSSGAVVTQAPRAMALEEELAAFFKKYEPGLRKSATRADDLLTSNLCSLDTLFSSLSLGADLERHSNRCDKRRHSSATSFSAATLMQSKDSHGHSEPFLSRFVEQPQPSVEEYMTGVLGEYFVSGMSFTRNTPYSRQSPIAQGVLDLDAQLTQIQRGELDKRATQVHTWVHPIHGRVYGGFRIRRHCGHVDRTYIQRPARTLGRMARQMAYIPPRSKIDEWRENNAFQMEQTSGAHGRCFAKT